MPEAAFRWRPPAALLGSLVAILGPQAATQGLSTTLLGPTKFIAVAAASIIGLDEILYRSCTAVLDREK
eukprot:6484972-Amphidinium_carterae.1